MTKLAKSSQSDTSRSPRRWTFHRRWSQCSRGFNRQGIRWTTTQLAVDNIGFNRRDKVTPLFAALLLLSTPAMAAPPPPAKPAAHASAGRHALLIGASDYHHYNANGIFPDLHCGEDLRRIELGLTRTFHFDPARGEITRLTTSEQTTRSAVMAAFDRLVESTREGDLVYIHWSGHGDQVVDPTEPTGYDSAIVPSDYKCECLPEDKTEQNSNEISGRTIRKVIAKLQAKHPAQIVLTFDSCHSGSQARGSSTVARRGISTDDYAQWYAAHHPNYHPAKTPPTLVARGIATPAAWPGLTGSGYVVISACRSEDSAYETSDDGKPVGRLSCCLGQVFAQAGEHTTYRQVYDSINAMFRQKFNDQYPQLDGDPNTTLFGGTATPPPPSIPVFVKAAGQYRLDAGSMQGMTAGSQFAIYSKDAAEFDDAHMIAEATLTDAGPSSSTLTIDRKVRPNLTDDDLSAARAIETRHDYGAQPLTLDTAALRIAFPARADAVLAKLALLKMVSTDLKPGVKPDFTVITIDAKQGGAKPAMLVRAETGHPIAELTDSSDLPDLLTDALRKETRYRYAAGLGVTQAGINPDYTLNIRIVPLDEAKYKEGKLVYGEPLAPNTPLDIGRHFVIDVQNLSRRPLHLALLDLESDGDVSMAWPATDSTTQDNIIPRSEGDTWTRLWTDSDITQPEVFVATTPDPAEIYKAIATRDYVNFAPLATRGVSRGGEGPFADLFGPALDEGERGTGHDMQVQPRTWTTASLGFTVR